MMYRSLGEVFSKTIKRSGVEGLYVGLQTRTSRRRLGYLAYTDIEGIDRDHQGIPGAGCDYGTQAEVWRPAS
jgi:hypothetical protein